MARAITLSDIQTISQMEILPACVAVFGRPLGFSNWRVTFVPTPQTVLVTVVVAAERDSDGRTLYQKFMLDPNLFEKASSPMALCQRLDTVIEMAVRGIINYVEAHDVSTCVDPACYC